jgi:Fe2+ transport system protein FeoA
VINSELVTRDSDDRRAAVGVAAGRLIDAVPGVALRIVRVEDEAGAGPDGAVAAVAAEGLLPGVVVSLERRIAFGGPLIVHLGRARLALSREVARRIVVEPAAVAEAAAVETEAAAP